ncbi:hypothetical protein ES703_124813 [subsurface metagenome]
MKRILLSILVTGVLLLSACGAPTTAPPAEAPSTEQQTYILSVSVSPSGAGSGSPSGGQYEEGAQVTLSATAASGYTFDYWGGDASGSSSTITITMNSDKSVIAYFKAADVTPPVISEVYISDITELSATINWVTDEPATSQVEYGTTSAYGDTTLLNEELDTNHSVTITELEPETSYHFRIKSADEAGNEALSGDDNFTTKTFAGLITAKIHYPPTTFPGISSDGKVIIPESYMLQFELSNGSSQMITITRVQIVNGSGREQISFGIDPNTVDAGETLTLGNVFENEPLKNWKVKWYCLDANGVEFTIIGACSSSD